MKPNEHNSPSDNIPTDNLETLALFTSRIDSRTRCSRDSAPSEPVRAACDRDNPAPKGNNDR